MVIITEKKKVSLQELIKNSNKFQNTLYVWKYYKMCLNSSVCSRCRQCRCNSVTIDVCRLKCFWKLLLSLEPYWIWSLPVNKLTTTPSPLWEGYSPNPRNSFAEKSGMSQTMGLNSYNNSNAWKMNTKVAMLFIRNLSPDIVCSQRRFLSVVHKIFSFWSWVEFYMENQGMSSPEIPGAA